MKYPTCTLSNVINPGLYCVVSTNKEHVSEVQELECKMMKEMLDEDTSEFELKSQMCVAVINTGDHYRRGVVENQLGEDLYQVFLIDYGQVIHVKRSEVKVITNKDFMEVEPLSFTVKLYGLVPTKYIHMGVLRKPKACKDWLPESKYFVENFFKEHCKIVVQSVLIQQRTVYGDLFIHLKSGGKFISLRKLLCEHEFCVYSENHFLRQEGLGISGESEELATKMELVEKWRKENFGNDFQKRSFQFPTPVAASKGDITDITSPCLSAPESVAEVPGQVPQASASEEDTSEASSGKPKSLGIGRGRIRLLIAEMKKKEDASKTQSSSSCEGETSMSRSESKVSLGRGQFLRKYLELKKSEKSKVPGVAAAPAAPAAPRTSSKTPTSERFSDADTDKGRPQTVSKLERALVRAGDFSELSDSNGLTEISLSTEDDVPPLAKNGTVERKGVLTGDGRGSGKGKNDRKRKWGESRPGQPAERENQKGPGPRRKEQRAEVESSRSVENWPLAENVGGLRTRAWEPYVRFDDCVVEPVKTFRELPIQPSIIKNLEKGGRFNLLSQVQRWAIPSIRKQLNTIVIGSPKTGKTLSYIVPLMDYVQDETYFEELPQGNGPLVVIVASSSRVCESIFRLCQSLLHQGQAQTSRVKIVLAHGGGREKEVWVTLTNGCDVLISTPHCLARLLEMPVLTNLERLTCLVLDEVDVISQNPFRKNVRIILEKAQFSTKSRYYQRILCGERWTPSVASLVKAYLDTYALVIGSYSEAVVHVGLKPSFYLVDRNKKPEVVLDSLKQLTGRKVVIVCEGTSEAASLDDFLTGNGVHSFLAHEKMMADKLKDVGTAWRFSHDSVLITTDGVLNELNIREAQALLHYALPNKSKTNFYLRYFTLENFLRDQQTSWRQKDESPSRKLQDIILVDDENHHQLPHIVDFIGRLGGKIPGKIVDKCQEIRRLKEVEKHNSPICGNLLAFGRCRNLENCTRRHALVESRDSRGHLPACGWVSFVVLRVHDASHYSVRLLEHADSSGKTSTLKDDHAELSPRLVEFYGAADNRRPHGVPAVGDACAVREGLPEDEGEVFHRARVVECLRVDKHEKPLEVMVKLMDRGDVWRRKSIELYELPEELSKYPPTAVDVRMVGLQPLDFDASWSEVAYDFAQKLMTGKLEENQYWSGKVVLALDGTLFLDLLKRKQFLPRLNTHVFDLSVRGELLARGIAVANDDHLPALLKLCSEAGLETPEEEVKKEESVVVQPQWAFLDLAVDFTPVRFLAAESTSTVFLQIRKFEKLLRDLEVDCQNEGEKAKEKGKTKKPNIPAVGVGMFCLALFEDGRWNRGRVESETEAEFYVFFVDHGDFQSVPKPDVVPIPPSLLLRLPCQAIECGLVGLEQREDTPLEVLERMYAFSDDGAKDLYAWVARKEPKATITGGRKYSLNLTDREGVSLNKMLVDSGLARAEESEREHLKDLDVEVTVEEDDWEQEKEKDLAEKEEPAVELSDEYFNGFTDDVFEDEMAQEFLKEFAAKVFNLSEPPRETTEKEGKRLAIEDTPRDVEAMEVEGAKPLQELEKQEMEPQEKDGGLLLRGREKVLTPQVLWCQNQVEVQMKILLGNVKDYSLQCTLNNISFRCLLGDKFYSVDLKLYGAINPEKTKVTLKAFQVLVVLTKLAFPLWPRLHRDEGRLRWINLDVESLVDKEDLFSDKIRSAKLEMDSGVVKQGRRNETILPCSDSEDSDAGELGSDSENSED